MYSSDWSGYAALPKTAGRTFTSIVANYNVPSVASSNSPYTFSFHWIGLDEWADQTVEQDGISANCEGSTPHYHAWYEMYAANSHYGIPVNPGDTIESSIIRYLGGAEYELSLKDVTSSQGFDVVQTCPVSACDNSSAEAITEAYYYDRQFLRHQRLRRRALRGCNRDRQRGQCRRPVRPQGVEDRRGHRSRGVSGCQHLPPLRFRSSGTGRTDARGVRTRIAPRPRRGSSPSSSSYRGTVNQNVSADGIPLPSGPAARVRLTLQGGSPLVTRSASSVGERSQKA